jgi:phage baseplate assembly protein V
MSLRAIAKVMAPLRRRVALMVRTGVLRLVRDSLATQELQVAVFDGEVLDRVKSLLPYGFSHHPLAGAEVLLVFPGGQTSNPVAVAVGGRAHRPTGLQPGEVCVYTNEGSEVRIERGGTIRIKAAAKVRVEAPLECTGEVKDRCDSGGRTMAEMRATYNGHIHGGVQPGGGSTATPNQGM